jgi:hypothetical protein
MLTSLSTNYMGHHGKCHSLFPAQIVLIRIMSFTGTPLGCADQVPRGVEPNEHGTWLYGRDGWCDGREVDPIVFDWTHVATPGSEIKITYRGTFNGTDPNPVHSPGYIILYSYLTIYKYV